ncbi:PREDICTED: protein FAM212B isoform X1 [Corvus brachyrhynchos]|uniref:protein FAM212B isoform X1 n=2 Tax=Corvus brachyrhynchos TaxID=85066 RepID=UPI0008166FBA|nr:PREDICTED: protein FAM212B isoform X1 [Corvus brachyrhynchos]XP_017596646.1 PREDICTED: protein FAM212B isoform X1 [Corvus brachyrhynchos]
MDVVQVGCMADAVRREGDVSGSCSAPLCCPVLAVLLHAGDTDPPVLFPPQLSMKEVGDGLHEQMNCMMGALQELKLLQVQTALEHLDISGRRSPAEQRRCCRSSGAGQDTQLGQAQGHCPPALACPVPRPAGLSHPTAFPESDHPRDTPSSSQSLCGEDLCPPKGPSSVSSRVEHVRPRTFESSSQGTAGGWLLCQECPGCDDGHDWTSSLMSQSRNRQPLVLGDNIFADLVGNWLDLPELDKKGEKSEASLSMSRSQELCRKFSLTANIFKKFLRSVRPDRDRLLKEKPCWLPPEDKRPEISKRSKKINKLKGTFYFPLHGNLQNHHSKAERCPRAESCSEHPKIGTKKVHDSRDYSQAGFDINTAVWV